jgi:hypothetical protein
VRMARLPTPDGGNGGLVPISQRGHQKPGWDAVPLNPAVHSAPNGEDRRSFVNPPDRCRDEVPAAVG